MPFLNESGDLNIRNLNNFVTVLLYDVEDALYEDDA